MLKSKIILKKEYMLIASDKNLDTRFREQTKLLEASERTGIPLANVLQRVGWSYDDLIYERSRKVKGRLLNSVDLIDRYRSIYNGTPVVSFFSGCGGIDLGFEAAGYKHVAAFEFNELFCKTLRRNRLNWSVYGPPTHSGDISKYDEVSNSLSQLIQKPFEGVFVGGPPCQPFSIAANQRFSKQNEGFKRVGFTHEKNGNLLFDYINLIVEFRPRVFVIENVPGLRDIDKGVQLSTAIKQLTEAGYHINEPFVINAAHYGIPQQRIRLFIIGARTSKTYKLPPLTIERLGAGRVLDEVANLANHETREHRAESILRYMRLNYGQRDQLGRVDRLDPDLPSKTVIAGGTNGGGRSHLHPEIPRTLSVRECARLQTFPDDFIFVGPPARQFTQVGNAVPPALAAQIATSITESYF